MCNLVAERPAAWHRWGACLPQTPGSSAIFKFKSSLYGLGRQVPDEAILEHTAPLRLVRLVRLADIRQTFHAGKNFVLLLSVGLVLSIAKNSKTLPCGERNGSEFDTGISSQSVGSRFENPVLCLAA
eukprot:s4445_g4.t3